MHGGEFSLIKPKNIICAWHLDRTWRKALAEHVKDKQEQITHHLLSILSNELDKDKFRATLQEFLTHIHANTNMF